MQIRGRRLTEPHLARSNLKPTMATAITFASAGRDGALVQIVDQSPEEVVALVAGSEGAPLELTTDGNPVFVNQSTIAFWRLHGRSDPERSQ